MITTQLLFVLWLAAPQSQGAVSLYSRLLHPFLIEREEQIDNKIDEVSDRGASINTPPTSLTNMSN